MARGDEQNPRRGLWEPRIDSHSVWGTGDNLELQLASEVGWEAQFCNTKPLPCGICHCHQVDSVRIEWNCRPRSQCWRMAWWCGKKPPYLLELDAEPLASHLFMNFFIRIRISLKLWSLELKSIAWYSLNQCRIKENYAPINTAVFTKHDYQMEILTNQISPNLYLWLIFFLNLCLILYIYIVGLALCFSLFKLFCIWFCYFPHQFSWPSAYLATFNIFLQTFQGKAERGTDSPWLLQVAETLLTHTYGIHTVGSWSFWPR